MIYLDSAATTLQKPQAVARAAARAINTFSSPGRGGYRPAMDAAEVAFRCREAAAELFQVPDPEQVVFTMNATHALNIAIKTLVKPGATVVVSGWEHNAVTRPLHAIEGVQLRVARARLFDSAGTVEAFRRAITEDVSVVVCTHVSNVFGFILPIEEIAALCHTRGVALIIDASQSAGCLPVNFERLGASFIACPGHKGLLGPQGTGLLLCGAHAAPLLEGGTGSESMQQEMPQFLPDRLEAGTHNIPGIAGLLEGILYVQRQGHTRIFRHERALTDQMAHGLMRIPGAQVFADAGQGAQAGVLSFNLAGRDCEDVGQWLGRRGIAVRAGLHCAPLAHSSAGTLEIGTVRASVSPFNTAQEIQSFISQVELLVAER